MSVENDPTSRKRMRAVLHDRAAYPRKRAVQACRTCRRRRTKCDNEQPSCTSCSELGIECIYEETGKSTFDSASLAILQRLDILEELIRATSLPSSGLSRSSSHTTPQNLESPALERLQDFQKYFINIETVLCWPVFNNHDFEKRTDLRYLLQIQNSDTAPSSLSIPSDFETNGSRTLLKAFFENVHIYNPVLEIAKVEGYARDAQLNGLGWDAQSCLLLLAFALGSISAISETLHGEISSDVLKSQDFLKANGFFVAAQKRMGILLCKSGIIEAQCFFLAGVYLMTTLRPIEAWKMFVQALACCQGIPISNNTNDLRSQEELQLQQSIYWTCFKSELELRLELNVANNSVWDLTYPVFFPSPPKGLKAQGETVWYFYLAEIALRRLGNRILNYIYKYESSQVSTSSVADAITNFEQQAEGWLNSLPITLKLDGSQHDVDGELNANKEHAALRFILNGHLLDCYEMMYWPFIVDAIYGNLKNDSGSQSFARKGFLLCKQRIEKNESGFYKRHHGTWLMLRSCTRSALVLLGAARAGLVDLLPPDWECSAIMVVQVLSYWGEEANDVPDRLHILKELMHA